MCIRDRSLTEESLAGKYIELKENHLTEINERYSDQFIKGRIQEISEKINSAIDNRDVVSVLTWFSGKPLFNELKIDAKLVSKTQLIEIIELHDLFEKIPELMNLRGKVDSCFSD